MKRDRFTENPLEPFNEFDGLVNPGMIPENKTLKWHLEKMEEAQKHWSNVPCRSAICTFRTRTNAVYLELIDHYRAFHKLDDDLSILMANRRKNTAEHHCETCGQAFERRKG